MELFLKSMLTGFAFLLAYTYDCSLLPNGTYKVKHTFNSVEPDSELKIERGFFSQKWVNGDSANGKLVWFYGCQFKLENANPPEVDTTELGRLLLKSFGEPVFELQKKRADTVFFRLTFRGNLHLTASKGYFLKVD
jgi:hypothetical protein